ncbi:MAG: porin family protein [Saprospiraceae bacterium]
MKFLRNIIIIIFFSSLSFNSFGQKIGLKLGVNSFRLKMSSEDRNSFTHKTKQVNLHIGLTAEFKFGNKFSIQPGLLFSKKNVRFKENRDPGYEYQSDYSPTFMEIPLSFKYYVISEKSKIYIFAGPYVSFGIGGAIKIQEQDRPDPINMPQTFSFSTLEEYDIWGDDDRLKKLDYGVSFGVGIDINNFEIEVFNNIGIPQIENGFNGITSAKTQSFGISFSLKFNTKYD